MRYSGYVKVLPKDKCLAIAKIVIGEQNITESQLLYFLPDDIFDSKHKIDFINNDAIEVYDKYRSDITWTIPFYFIERIVEYEE